MPLRPHTLLLSSALLLATSLGAPTPAGAAVSDWSENPESKVRLITPYRVAPVGQEVWLGLHFELSPGWHVYWKNSGDAGFPPVIDLESTPELGDAELLWPAPERYELPGDLVAFGYEDEVVYPIRARLGDGVFDPLEIALVVDYLVCKIDCIPYRYTLRLEQPTGPEAVEDPETAPLLARWRETLPLPVAEVAGVATRGWLDLSGADGPVLDVTVTGAEAAGGARPELFLESHELYDLGTPALSETPDGLRFRVPLDPLRALDEPPANATFAWTVTGLALPDGRGAIEARHAVPAGTEPPADAERDETAAATATGVSYVRLFARALLGGLVLALTPAALALLLLVIADLRYGRGTAMRVAAAIAGAVAAALSLAATAFALGGPGTGGWNALLQRPLGVTALALVALGFALRLWGFAGASGRTLPEESSAGSLAVRSFGYGLLLPLLALPWPVPPAPGAVDGAMAAGTATGLAAAALVALGLALPLGLPLVLAGSGAALFAPRRRGQAQAEIFAAGRRSPFREALGFLAALSVVWLLYVLSGLVGSEDLAFVELSLLGVGLAGWAWRRASVRGAHTTARVWMLLAAAAAGAALWIATAV